MPPPTQRTMRTGGACPIRGRPSTFSGTLERMPDTRNSPGVLAAQAARRIALAALYWGPIVFLLATVALVVELWKGTRLGPVIYVAVAVLATLGVASGWVLQRRLAEISHALERAQRTTTVGLVTAGF